MAVTGITRGVLLGILEIVTGHVVRGWRNRARATILAHELTAPTLTNDKMRDTVSLQWSRVARSYQVVLRSSQGTYTLFGDTRWR